MVGNIEQVFVILFVFGATSSEAKSLGAIKINKITKRQLLSPVAWEDICPPPFIEEYDKNCTDTCHTNDYCTGRQLCCELGGCKACMDPVLPPAVIDWVDNTDKVPAPPHNETDNTIYLKEPHYNEVAECVFEGRSYPEGVFFRGCRKCFCNHDSTISCQVGPCTAAEKTVFYIDKERAPDYGGSGSGHGSDNEETTAGPINERDSNEFRPINKGESGENLYEIIRPKAEFRAFDPPRSEHSEPTKTEETSNTADTRIEESGDDESGDGQSGDGNVVERLKQRHSTHVRKITRHENAVDKLEKVEDIFLI